MTVIWPLPGLGHKHSKVRLATEKEIINTSIETEVLTR